MTDVKKETVARVFFGPTAREVRVEIDSISQISPRKIEIACAVLKRDFKRKLGEAQHQAGELIRKEEAARKALTAAEQEAQQKAYEVAEAKRQEELERTEFKRLSDKFGAKPAVTTTKK